MADFPQPARGQTLQEFADGIGGKGTELGLAGSVFAPGRNRVAFGVISGEGQFVYGPTAIYIARGASSTKIAGPYLAPADLLITEPAFRSEQAATEQDPFAAVYAADDVPFPKAGDYAVLAVTKSGDALSAAAVGIKVEANDRIPAVGDLAPKVDTDTVASAGGDVKSIDTRRPTSDMHRRSFKDVVGTKPVALLFATPQLCQSRVCGPVVDIALQMQERYGDQVEFIHQEVYVDNDLNKGIREPLQRFGLQTEPWLFTVGRDGRIAARLEGSFGLKAFDRAAARGDRGGMTARRPAPRRGRRRRRAARRGAAPGAAAARRRACVRSARRGGGARCGRRRRLRPAGPRPAGRDRARRPERLRGRRARRSRCSCSPASTTSSAASRPSRAARRTTSSRASVDGELLRARHPLRGRAPARGRAPQRELIERASCTREENARLERGLLPQPLVARPARCARPPHYRPGRRRALLGGDFYDAVADRRRDASTR